MRAFCLVLGWARPHPFGNRIVEDADPYKQSTKHIC
jgi:hypothetical protein